MNKAALFRCDANADTGLGHLSRCLALAEGLEESGIRGHFLGTYSQRAAGLIASAGFTFREIHAGAGSPEDLSATLEAWRQTGAVFLVLDSYAIGAEFLKTLQKAGAPVVLFDDFCRLPDYPCRIILNFTVAGPEQPYPAERVSCLLGPAFFPARRALRRLRAEERKPRSGPPARMLLSMGGGDSAGLTPRVVRAVTGLAGRPVLHVVCSGHSAEITALLDTSRGDRLFGSLDGLAEELRGADICVTGGGLTKYECAYLGIPQAVVNQTSEQAWESARFAALHLCRDLGLGSRLGDAELAAGLAAFLEDEDGRRAMTSKALALFPADSVERLVAAILREIRP